MQPTECRSTARVGAGLWRLLGVGLLLLGGVATLQAAPKRVALLVGVGDYAQARDLAGARNDAEALREALIAHWGFAPDDIVTLVDDQATKARILAELGRLKTRSAPGDHVLFFFSGHGTSRFDPSVAVPLDPYSGAVLPHDAITYGEPDELASHLLVGRTDIRPLLSALDADREVTVIYDACFSGNAVRSLARVAPTRHQPLVVVEDPTEEVAIGSAMVEDAPEYPYRNVFFLAAASDREQAIDIDSLLIGQHPTRDGKPHGAFTDALLRVLDGDLPADTNGDGSLDNTELREAIARRLSDQQIPHRPQSLPPYLEDRRGLSKRALFSYKGGAPAAKPDQPDPTRLRVRLEGKSSSLADTLRRRELDLVGPEAIADLIITGAGSGGYLLHGGTGELIGQAGQTSDLLVRIGQLEWFQAMADRAATSNPFGFRLRLSQESCGEVLCMGNRISFNLETERPVHVLLLDLDAKGAINQLYPADQTELTPVEPGAATYWPASLDGRPDPIQVQEPEGTDLVLAFGFTERPDFLVPFYGELPPSGALLERLQRALERNPERMAVAALRLVAKRCESAVVDDRTRCAESTR